MENVLLIVFEQIVSFCAIVYSNTSSLKLFCENSSLNLANFTYRVFSLTLESLPEPKHIIHKCHLCHLWQIPCLACISVCELRIFAVQRKIDVRFSQIWQMPQFTFWQRMCAQFLSNSNWGFSGDYFIQLTDLSRQESLSGGVWCADNSKSFISPVMPAKTRWVRWEESLNKQASCANVGRAKMIGCQRGRERKLGKSACC